MERTYFVATYTEKYTDVAVSFCPPTHNCRGGLANWKIGNLSFYGLLYLYVMNESKLFFKILLCNNYQYRYE